MDEPYTVYGLVAEKMERGADGLSLRFYLNPKARFADGTPITADDVKYTYELLMTQGNMQYRTQFEAVKGLEVESPCRSVSTSSTATAAPCPWTSLHCRYSPNTGGNPATSPVARGLKFLRAAGLTPSAMSTGAHHHVSTRPRLVGQRPAGQQRPVQLRHLQHRVFRRH